MFKFLKPIFTTSTTQPIPSKPSEKLEYRVKSISIDLFGSEPNLKKVVADAINNLELPPEWPSGVVSAVKMSVIKRYIEGGAGFDKETEALLYKKFLKTKRDVRHAYAKIAACASSAITFYRYDGLGVKKYKWSYIENLCDVPGHKDKDGKIYNVKGAEKPACIYGCRCMSFSEWE